MLEEDARSHCCLLRGKCVCAAAVIANTAIAREGIAIAADRRRIRIFNVIPASVSTTICQTIAADYTCGLLKSPH